MAALQQSERTGSDLHAMYRIVRPDGSTVWVENFARCERDAAGAPSRMLGVIMDITAHKSAEEQQRLMVRELHHRVKNTLAVVQAIADQTARRSSSLAIFNAAFGGRLHALSIAHSMLTETRWSGVELTVLLRESLAPYRDRLHLQGPPIMLPSQTIVPMSIIVHELMTNAAKYGAL